MGSAGKGSHSVLGIHTQVQVTVADRSRSSGRAPGLSASIEAGFTLAEIQGMFDLSAHRRATGELRARAMAKVAGIDARIGRLNPIRADLSTAIVAECDSLTDFSCGLLCPLPFVELSD